MRLPDIPIRAEEITPETKCSFCDNSKCCQYITHQIDTPRSKADFDYLLWQVSHRNVKVFKDEGGWFLQFDAACTHLQANGHCGIYESRPQICRDHSNDYCEYDEPAERGFEFYFDSYESLAAYCRKRFKKWDAWTRER